MHTNHSHLERILNRIVGRVFETNGGQLRRVPNHILALTLFVCASVVFQGIADIVLKLTSYTTILPALPWRTDFLFLTFVSVLMGYRTLGGMHHRKFDVTKNSIELGLLVEIALIVGDMEFIYLHVVDIPHVLLMRLPFIILTIINVMILIYNYSTLRLHKWWYQEEV